MRTFTLALTIGLMTRGGDYVDQIPKPVWNGPGWYQISYSIAVIETDPLKGSLGLIDGPFVSKRECEKTLPPNQIEPGLFSMEGDVRVEYWCDEEKERPPWLGREMGLIR